MSTNENTAPKQDVYRKVTDAIITTIENGVGQYRMPWTVRQDRGFSPISVGSAKPYRGINTLVLWAQAQSKGWSPMYCIRQTAPNLVGRSSTAAMTPLEVKNQRNFGSTMPTVFRPASQSSRRPVLCRNPNR